MIANKKSRLNHIVDILNNNTISNQEELLLLLTQRGITVTQATLSRDLKRLHTTKITDKNGHYRYVITDTDSWPEKYKKNTATTANYNIPRSPLQPMSMTISNNMIVLKTRNGYASGLAYDIDTLASGHILGTIAGTDTVFVVVNPNSSRQDIINALSPVVSSDLCEKAFLDYSHLSNSIVP